MLQTFPNNFIFTRKLNSQYKQVGNAVPVKLSKKVAQGIMDILKDVQKKENK